MSCLELVPCNFICSCCKHLYHRYLSGTHMYVTYSNTNKQILCSGCYIFIEKGQCEQCKYIQDILYKYNLEQVQ